MPILANIFKDNIKDDLFNVCSFLLKSFKTKHSDLHLKSLLTGHLNSSSLLAVQDTLSDYGILSAAVRKGSHSYLDFELPFICAIQQIDWPTAAFTVVTDITNNTIDYLDPASNEVIKTNMESFQSIDKGIIMLIDGAGAIDESNLKQHVLKQQTESFLADLPLAVIFISLLGCIAYIVSHYDRNFSLMTLCYLLTTCIGVFISLMLLWHEFDKDNKLIKQVCGTGGKKVNCNAVLSSSHSSIFGISWSIWGGAFFCTLFLIQMLFIGNFSFLIVTASLSLLVVPYIFYSIYVQWRILKQWCPLCLGIQTLLFVNALIAIGVFSQTADLHQFNLLEIYPFITTLVIFILILILIFSILPVLKLARDSKVLEKNLKMFKSDKNVFRYFLDKSEPISYPVDGLGIIVGNPEASNEIIKVCNPYCGPCSDMHPNLEQVIKTNRDVRLRIIFTASIDKNDIGRKPVTHFLAIQEEFGNKLVHTAIDAWYRSPYKDYETFADRFIVNSKLENQNEKVRAMHSWAESMKIRVTPTLFVNGHELPAEFKVDDLMGIL